MKRSIAGVTLLSLFLGGICGAAEEVKAEAGLSADKAKDYAASLWEKRLAELKVERADEVEKREVRAADKTMRYLSETFGEKPEGGRSLFISMHGGGNAPARVNDQQWQNQIRLYQPEEGIYVAPRAPTDTWNLWHEGHIDDLFDRLIENLVALEDVNRDRVYIMGYSAGGDGVYQLAPRMSDRFAAAAMMAGHPNETSPLGLRNIPFALQVGALDGGFKRNAVAAEWEKKLDELHKEDAGGYEHFVAIRPGKPHWMDLEDKVAVPWMAKFERRRFPDRVVWKQDDRTHSRSYWLAIPEDKVKAGQLIVASREGQVVTIEKAEDVGAVTILLNDAMVDLDEPVKVVMGDKVLFEGKVKRSREVIARTLAERDGPGLVFCGEVRVSFAD